MKKKIHRSLHFVQVQFQKMVTMAPRKVLRLNSVLKNFVPEGGAWPFNRIPEGGVLATNGNPECENGKNAAVHPKRRNLFATALI